MNVPQLPTPLTRYETLNIGFPLTPSKQLRKGVAQTNLSSGSRSTDSLPIRLQVGRMLIIYTTSLRGIGKTFEDCNIARSIMESYELQMFDWDISMDSEFKEELTRLMGTKEVIVTMVFVKGRMIGGVEAVGKMDEEGRVGKLLNGVPKAAAGLGGCMGCGGVRFVMCGVCDGSCKVLDDKGSKSLKCGECNENDLIHCPICSSGFR